MTAHARVLHSRSGRDPGAASTGLRITLAARASRPRLRRVRGSSGGAASRELVERCCSHARRFAERDRRRFPAARSLNDVVLNQVLFRFADDATTSAALAAVQAGGEAWMSGTTWDGRPAIRLSVSGWRTTDDDIERTVAAFARALAEVPAARV